MSEKPRRLGRVTGASPGIRRALEMQCATNGFDVIVAADRRDRADGVEARRLEWQLTAPGNSGNAQRWHCECSGGLRQIHLLFSRRGCFQKGLTLKMGQTHLQRFMPELLKRVEQVAIKPTAIIAHRMPFAGSAGGYQIFADKEEDDRKVVSAPSFEGPNLTRHRQGHRFEEHRDESD